MEKYEKLSLVIYVIKLIEFSHSDIFYFYFKTTYLIDQTFYSQEINPKKLHEFANTTCYKKYQRDFIFDIFYT